MQKEPAAIVGVIVAAIAGLIALLVAFGLDLSQTQQVAILGVVAPVYALAQAIITRAKVFAPRTVQQLAARTVPTIPTDAPPSI